MRTKKKVMAALIMAVIMILFAEAVAETKSYNYLCYTNEHKTTASAIKADTEHRFYVTQTSTSDPFPVKYTVKDSSGTVVSHTLEFEAGATGKRKKSYYSSHSVIVNGYYRLVIFPSDGVYTGHAGIQVAGRWTP